MHPFPCPVCPFLGPRSAAARNPRLARTLCDDDCDYDDGAVASLAA